MGAAEAPPSRRIEFRDPISKFGAAGIDRVAPWLGNPEMAAFAIRVIARAGELGAADEARRALRHALSGLIEPARGDAALALSALGVSGHGSAGERPRRATPARDVPAMSVEDFVMDRVYRRQDIHDGGLGGNRQKGISYPAGGTYVLLFSRSRIRGMSGGTRTPGSEKTSTAITESGTGLVTCFREAAIRPSQNGVRRSTSS